MIKFYAGILSNVLLNELQVSKSNLKLLIGMYTDIKASICINYQFYEPLIMHEGVRQGFLARPIVFSLYIDRLEAFLKSSLLAHLNSPEKRMLRVAGILLPILLFIDTIVFLATQ